MNRRTFLKWFGIGVPAAVVAAVVVPKLSTSVPETVTEDWSRFPVEARLGEWNNYYSEGDIDIYRSTKNWKSHPYRHTVTLTPRERALFQTYKYKFTS